MTLTHSLHGRLGNSQIDQGCFSLASHWVGALSHIHRVTGWPMGSNVDSSWREPLWDPDFWPDGSPCMLETDGTAQSWDLIRALLLPNIKKVQVVLVPGGIFIQVYESLDYLEWALVLSQEFGCFDHTTLNHEADAEFLRRAARTTSRKSCNEFQNIILDFWSCYFSIVIGRYRGNQGSNPKKRRYDLPVGPRAKSPVCPRRRRAWSRSPPRGSWSTWSASGGICCTGENKINYN